MFKGLNKDVLKELHKLHLNLDHLYAIELSLGEGSLADVPNSVLQALVRKKYLDEQGNAMELGKKLHSLLSAPDFKSGAEIRKDLKALKDNYSVQFLEWWAAYPATDGFEKNGKRFEGTRALRVDKEKCEKKYLEILGKGVNHNDMVEVLGYIVYLKQSKSVKTGENHMSYIPGSLPYLNSGGYEAYISAMKEDKTYSNKKKQVFGNGEVYI